MKFNKINIETYDRIEYFKTYHDQLPCTYSLTVDIDTSNLAHEPLYCALLYCLNKTVNQFESFKTTYQNDVLGYYESMNIAYTIFNQTTKKFACVYIEYNDNYLEFKQAYINNKNKFKDFTTMYPTSIPDNCFNCSVLPNVSFTSFNLNLQKGYNYLLPIFTLGKKTSTTIPLAIQVHHAVCDGYHIGEFINQLQLNINSL